MAALGLWQQSWGDSGAAGLLQRGLVVGELQMGPAGAELMMQPGKTQCGLGRKGWTRAGTGEVQGQRGFGRIWGVQPKSPELRRVREV